MSDTSRPTLSLWFPFAHQIIRSGTWKTLSKRAKAVYPVICVFANFDTGECYPSLTTIEELSGIGRSWVSKAITELVEAGLIVRRSGDHSHSNRYKVLFWGSTVTAPPQSLNGTTPGATPGPGEVPLRPSNYTQVTIANVNTTKNHQYRRQSGGGGGVPVDWVGLLTSELGLKDTGVSQLNELIERYTAEKVKEAGEEAVSQGRPTLKYMEGILKNWDRQGRVVRSTRKEAAKELQFERKTEASRNRGAVDGRREEAREMAKAKISECGARELSVWRGDAEVEADAGRIPGALRDAFIESRVLLRVAEKFGIEGL